MTLDLRKIVTAALLVVTSSLGADAGWGRLTDEERVVCAVPAPSTGAKVVLLSTAGARGRSSATIGSQDNVTWTAGVEIEAGSEPLYVVLVANAPIIWRFSGAVERLEHIVLSSTRTGSNQTNKNQEPLVGASGVPAKRLTFVKSPKCFRPFARLKSIDGAVTVARVRNAIRKKLDVIESFHRVGSVSLPSMTPGEGPQRPAVPSFYGRYSLGQDNVIQIDPHSVIASRPVEPYDLLPGEAGLAQLVALGALSRVEKNEYIIHRKIRFPPGLSGVSRLGFLLLRGVPEPVGDPGSACVVSEETGAPLSSGC